MSTVTLAWNGSDGGERIRQRAIDWSNDSLPTVSVDSHERPRRENMVERDFHSLVQEFSQ